MFISLFTYYDIRVIYGMSAPKKNPKLHLLQINQDISRASDLNSCMYNSLPLIILSVPYEAQELGNLSLVRFS